MTPTADQIELVGDFGTWLAGPGTGVHIVMARGLESQNVKDADLDLLGDGVVFGQDRLAAKTVVLELNLEAATEAALQTLLDEFQEAWEPAGDKLLVWMRRGTLRHLTGRTRRHQVDETLSHGLSIDILAEFVANPESLGGS